jgi:hypothetical protein
MQDRNLAIYLNDHLAGSEGALELLDHLKRLIPELPVGQFAADLKAEITADRKELEALIARFHIPQRRTRKAAGWIADRFTDLKLHVDGR